MDNGAAVMVRDLRKSYRDVAAVRGIDLEINRGEVFALLGPNGAGKTTTVEILEGFRRRDHGTVDVLGEDPARAGRAWRARIGIVLQLASTGPELTVLEIVRHFAAFYPASRRAEEAIALVGLTSKAGSRIGQLSGGQTRRLDVALGIVGRPELLFLDEPTTGFDPEARRQFWELIKTLRGDGTTIVLTTHYLDEAEALADRIAVIAAGRIVAGGDAGHPGRPGQRGRPGRLGPARRSAPHRRDRHADGHDRGTGRRVRRRDPRAHRHQADARGRLPGPHRGGRGRRAVMTHGTISAGARTRTGEAALPGAWQLGMARGGVEVKTFFRDKMAVAFIFGLPSILLVLLGSIFGSQAAAQGVTVGQLFTAGMIAGGLMSTSFQYLAITIATERENGMLKRLSGTPMPRTAYFAGKVVQVTVCARRRDRAADRGRHALLSPAPAHRPRPVVDVRLGVRARQPPPARCSASRPAACRGRRRAPCR